MECNQTLNIRKLKTKTKYKIVTRYTVMLSWDKRCYNKELGEIPPKFKLKEEQKSKSPYTILDPVACSAIYQNAYKILSKKVA